jgi:hypothetical protein
MRASEFIVEVKARYEMTELDPWTFDQTTAGWRGLPSSARQADAIRQYIDTYVKNGQFVNAPEGAKTLRPYILYWHLGQVLLQMGRNGMAVGVMRQALDDGEAGWNAYVMATISFLRKDRRDFDHWAPLARGNEETIKRLTAGWGLPYKQAYAGQQAVEENFADGNSMSTKDMIAYLRQHHDTNLHQDYLDHINTFGKFVLKNIPVSTIKTELSGLDRAKVERYKQMDFDKAPPIVMGDGYILDGYHRAVAAKELDIPTIRAYVGSKGQQDMAENFADGKKPGRKGLSKRVGIPKKASLSQLQKIASSSTGERRRMAQWQLNMRRGKAKKK